MSMSMTEQHGAASDVERKRLVAFFGVHPAELILQHLEDLEGTFGSGAVVIRNVMRGYSQRDAEKEGL